MYDVRMSEASSIEPTDEAPVGADAGAFGRS
jgi:hypothetical protein